MSRATAVRLAAIAVLGAVGAYAPSAQAAVPIAHTGRARQVTFDSATLTGAVNPRGGDTTYFFQYGPTRAYGAQTAVAGAGAGTRAVAVALPAAGLAALTQYHYRLVALNSSGSTVGDDHTFQTTKIPLSLQILAAPNPVPFGGSPTIEGTLSGTGAAGRGVELQANPFPYTQGFVNIGNPELTNSAGAFGFPVVGLTGATQFRVVTIKPPLVISPVVIEGVSVIVNVHVGRAGRRHHARIYGTVVPAEDGMEVGIVRSSHGRLIPVGATFLRHRNASSSRFSKVLRVRPGVYAVLVRVTDGAHSPAYSRPLLIR